MRKYFRPALATVIAIAAAACSSEKQHEIPTLDIAGNIGANYATLNDVFDFAGVLHPELTDSTMLSYTNVRGVYGDNIYLQEDNRLMVFSLKDGRCVSSFDRTGQGPEDYNMLYFAYVSEENGDWMAFDLRGHKLMRYTPTGKFVGAYPINSEGICPDGKSKWAGQKDVVEGEKQVIYIYDDNFILTDSIVTPFPRYFMVSNTLFPFNGQPTLEVADTLYMVTLDNKISPTIAFNLGAYLSPDYKEDEFDKMLAERDKYISYRILGGRKLAGVLYTLGDNKTLQFYSLKDNSLLFSKSVPSKDIAGITFTAEGVTYNIAPTIGQPTDDILYVTAIPENQEDEEDNPTILMLKIKPEYRD